MTEFKYGERKIECALCEKCVARKGEILTSKLRGSSFRGRNIEEGELFNVEANVIAVGEFTVAVVEIANLDNASREHDAEFIHATFEQEIPKCEKPTLDLTGSHCTPASLAVDKFMEVNY